MADLVEKPLSKVARTKFRFKLSLIFANLAQSSHNCEVADFKITGSKINDLQEDSPRLAL